MTWWAAVLGFAGALAGSWGGQLIASRREDRRWQREREREDLRHEREMERLRLQHEREVELAWRSERHAAYTRLLTTLLAFEDKVYAPIENPEVVHDTAEREDVRRIHNELHDVYMLVLVGSGSAVDEAGRRMILLCKRIARWYEPADPSAHNEQPDYESQSRAFADTFDDLTEACRTNSDLGAEARRRQTSISVAPNPQTRSERVRSVVVRSYLADRRSAAYLTATFKRNGHRTAQ